MPQTWALKLDSYTLKYMQCKINNYQAVKTTIFSRDKFCLFLCHRLCQGSTHYNLWVYTVFYSKDSHFEYTLNVEQLTEAKDHNINVFTHSPTWTHFHKLGGLQSGWVLAVMEWISEGAPWTGLLDQPSLCYTTLMIFIVLRNVSVGITVNKAPVCNLYQVTEMWSCTTQTVSLWEMVEVELVHFYYVSATE